MNCEYCKKLKESVHYYKLTSLKEQWVRAICIQCYLDHKGSVTRIVQMTAEEYVIWSVHNT